MTVAVALAHQAGVMVKRVATDSFEEWSQDKFFLTTKVVAETMHVEFNLEEGVSALLYETTRDRFSGYPNHTGYANDLLVPFPDTVSGVNVYPIQAANLLPLDWNIDPTDPVMNPELFLGRETWYDAPVSMFTPSIHFQGTCDPSSTDPQDVMYYRNCTDANNDLQTGGIVQPTTTFQQIHRKVSDYAPPIMKSLFEITASLETIGLFFANDGAGASVMYPARPKNSQLSYQSEGCTWLLLPNPLDSSKTIGTEAQVNRCRPHGTIVSSSRDFNPLETSWCRMQALSPDTFHIDGPYQGERGPNQWLIGVGQGIYDRITNEFIGCTKVELNADEFGEFLNDFSLTDTSAITLARWDSGTVVKSQQWDASAHTTTITVEDLGVSQNVFKAMKDHIEIEFIPKSSQFSSSTSHDGDHHRALSIEENGRVYAGYPVPVPPEEYDPEYRPQFIVILSVEASSLYKDVDNMGVAVNERVSTVVKITLITGTLGIVVVSLCIYLVSMFLTKPMELINKVGDQIVQNFGSSVKDIDQDISKVFWLKYSPPTEIVRLLKEFEKMVNRFSGNGTAELDFHRDPETKNPFPANFNALNFLYRKRAGSKFVYDESALSMRIMPEMASTGAPIGRSHWGPNHHLCIRDGQSDMLATEHSKESSHQQENPSKKPEWRGVLSSPLFWWILGTISLPLLMTMVAISGYLAHDLMQNIPELVREVQDSSIEFEISSLQPLAQARAHFGNLVAAGSFRDLHIFTRAAGWILFGATQKSFSYPAMITGAEQCKHYPFNQKDCPFFNQIDTACDCDWPVASLPQSAQCYDYKSQGIDSRNLQRIWWVGSNETYWPNGDVNYTRYPSVATTPNTTSFWAHQLDVAGHESGLNNSASGYYTTYEALRNVAAYSYFLLPLQNYQESVSGNTVGFYTSMDRKGILAGFTGCDHSHANYAWFHSDDRSGAYLFDPVMCPKGKYGYDPRCRNWYFGGKEQHLKYGTSYLTPPFVFTANNKVHQLANMPLIDPVTGFYVGMTMVDLNGEKLFASLTNAKTPLPGEGFHFMGSSTRDKFGSDTVVAPGFTLQSLKTEPEAPLEKFILPNDKCTDEDKSGCSNIDEFTVVRKKMQEGGTGNAVYTRKRDDGKEEKVYVGYAPVKIRSFRPIDPSDFNAAVAEIETHVFTVGLAQTESSLEEMFDSIGQDLDRTTSVAVPILLACIVVAFLGVAFMSARVASSISRPVRELLVVVRSFNQDKTDNYGDMPAISGGSMELRKVRATFERLHMVVRFANSAYYSGDLNAAYSVLKSSLTVFRKLQNSKAIGVAHNNLGNTMLTIYRAMKETGAPSILGLTKQQAVLNGIEHFGESIDAGEVALASINKLEGWSNKYLIFMQQLSNRYFNRAIFLLSSKEDHPDPTAAVQLGMQDLVTSKDMDCEVVNNGDQYGFKGDDDVHYELLLSRLQGLIHVVDMGYDDDWGIEELLEETRGVLNAALKDPDNTTMFRELEPAGQMQRLDGLMIRYYNHINEKEKAAMVAIRMLKEDEYVIGKKATLAIKALIDVLPTVESEFADDANLSDLSSTLFQYRRMVADVVAQQMNTVTEEHRPLAAGGARSSIRMVMNECLKQSNKGDVLMEHW